MSQSSVGEFDMDMEDRIMLKVVFINGETQGEFREPLATPATTLSELKMQLMCEFNVPIESQLIFVSRSEIVGDIARAFERIGIPVADAGHPGVAQLPEEADKMTLSQLGYKTQLVGDATAREYEMFMANKAAFSKNSASAQDAALLSTLQARGDEEEEDEEDEEFEDDSAPRRHGDIGSLVTFDDGRQLTSEHVQLLERASAAAREQALLAQQEQLRQQQTGHYQQHQPLNVGVGVPRGALTPAQQEGLMNARTQQVLNTQRQVVAREQRRLQYQQQQQQHALLAGTGDVMATTRGRTGRSDPGFAAQKRRRRESRSLSEQQQGQAHLSTVDHQPNPAGTLLLVDAFATRFFEGNPAAVLLLPFLAQLFNSTPLQVMASEMNLSETAFVAPWPARQRSSDDAHFALRWFTPTNEVPLCGHATLATAHAIYEQRIVPTSTTIHFHIGKQHEVFDNGCGSGPGELVVRRNASGEVIMSLPRGQPKAIAGNEKFPLPALHRALGLLTSSDQEGEAADTQKQVGEEVKELQFCAITRKLLYHVSSPEVVRRCKPDFSALEGIVFPSTTPVRGVIVTAAAGDDEPSKCQVVSRYFTPWNGIPEDPVTGSAHTVLGPYWAEKLGTSDLRAYQASTRGGYLTLYMPGAPSDSIVEIRGTAITVMRGHPTFQIPQSSTESSAKSASLKPN